MESVEYFHLELEMHDVILAEGAPTETFVEDDNRMIFQNASEYFALYPQERKAGPVRYCAPRLEDGHELEALRRRLLGRGLRLGDNGVAAASALRGHLDLVRHDRVDGWAFDPEHPDVGTTVVLVVNGAEVARVVADRYRTDLAKAGVGDGRHAFSFAVPGGLASDRMLRVELCHAGDWGPLGGSPVMLAPAASDIVLSPLGSLRGLLDFGSHQRVSGWAQDEANGERRVGLLISVNGTPVGSALANRYRSDLVEAGMGSGHHGFELVLPAVLSTEEEQEIRVVREADGAELPGSPQILPAVRGFEPPLRQMLSDRLDQLAVGAEEEALVFLAQETDKLLAQQAARASGAAAREALRRHRRRWGGTVSDGVAPGLRALVIDDVVPVERRDGGSVAILSHVAALQALGYAVSFAAANEMAHTAGSQALAALSASLCGAPQYSCIEEVLCRQAGTFDLVYLHRLSNADSYLAVARRH
jgi:hypothetical protein